MASFWLHGRAPFAAFRWMQAGVWRATSPVIPPSAAWGLVLNLAGIDFRDRLDEVATPTREDAPAIEIAVGERSRSERAALYQQLHAYPVGNTSASLAARTHGAKYHIAPVRRELLVGFDAIIGVRSASDDLADRVRRGLRGDLPEVRYGLPFAGDNNLLFDSIHVLTEAPEAHWYTRVDEEQGPRRGSCRLTVGIDRADSSRTTTVLVAPETVPTAAPPEEAWLWTPRPPGAPA